MKRCLTLGISLCLLGLLSGCCCGQRCGFARGACSPCGQPFGGFAPFNGGCNSCGTPGFGAPPAYGTPYGQAVPSTYLQPNGMAMSPEGLPIETTSLPPVDGQPVTAYGQPTYNQTSFNQAIQGQPAYGQPAPFAEGTPPVTTALMKPESLATY